MSWIKFDTATPDKPEVWQIASDLKIDADAVVGKLLRVWAWFDVHSEDGNAPIVTKVTLDRHVGNAGFCDAMVRAGWMVEADGHISLPNFDRHNGQTAKNRALTAQRVANHKRKGNGAANAQVTTTALPREEKRREDKDQEQKTARAPRSPSVSAQTLIDQHAVDPQVAADYLALRKAKRAPLTQTALDGLLTGFATAGLTPDAGLRICISKNWQGFDPSWLTGGTHGTNQPGRPLSAVDRVRRNAERAGFGDQPAGRTFDAQQT